ncbi:MAG: MFS transporter [SAR86 cluster bacterium]|uniref:MFS transporter n=1 Tax=SAR86 cluster bacterium TaxID=2030880 RepID=A0A937M2S1_9GAMM|nr:MFS transporter [SAR86 cluster bacterium]
MRIFLLSFKSDTFRSYSQLALIVVAAGAIYPLLYLRQNFEISILESFDITQTQLRYCSSMLGLIFMISYIPSGWLADHFSSRKLLAYSLLATALIGIWFSTMPSYSSLLVIYGAWGIATGLAFWSAHIKLVSMLARKDQQGKFFGILDGGRGLVEAILATIAITLFAYVISQRSGSTSIALQQVIYLYIGVLLVVSPLVYWLLDDFDGDDKKITNTNFLADLRTILKHREIWLCAICIVCGYQLFYATYSFSAYLQQNFGLTAVAVGTITVAKLWMRPIGGIAAGFIADWSSPEKVLSILLIAASLSLGIMAFLPTNSAVIFMILVVLLIGFLTYGVRGVYWATLDGCNIPNQSKGLAIGVISMIGYFPEFYLPLISAPLLEQYPGVLGYQIYYLIISGFGFIGAYAAYLLMQPKS